METLKLDIATSYNNNDTEIKVCINCVDDTCNISDIIKTHNDGSFKECLASVILRISKGKKYIVMNDFYNNALKAGRGMSYVSEKLRGGIYAMLCILLNTAINKGLINENDDVYLPIKIDIKDDLKEENLYDRVVEYYNMLGFTLMGNKMGGRAGQILNVCENREVSKELKNILKNI